MPAPQARFQFVAEGGPEVQAQADAINRKLIEMKARAREATTETHEGMHKAMLSTHLLNEEIGLQIPRAMQRVLAMTPGLGKALAAAFSITAAVGFIEIIGKLIEKMPELTNAMMGFGEAAQKAFDELKKGNQEIVDALTQVAKQAQQDSLLGLSGSKLISGQQGFAASDLESLKAQRETNAKRQQALRARADEQIVLSVDPDTGQALGTEARGLLADEQEQLDKLSKEWQDLTAKINLAQGSVESLGKHFTHAVGDEATAAIEKAHAAIDKITQALGEKGKDPITQQLDQASASYDDQIAKLKEFGRRAGLTQKEITDATVYLITLRGFAVQKKLDEINASLSTQHLKFVGKALDDIGAFNGPDVPNPWGKMAEDFAAANKLITSGLEVEAAKEKLITDQAKVNGDTQIQVEQKLGALRAASAPQLQEIADKMLEIANTLKDPQLIEQAKKFEAKIEDLRTKTVTWQIELKKTITDDLQNAFIGVVSGTETVSQAFQHMAQSILAELAKIVFQMYVIKLLQMALGGIFGGGSASSAGNSVGSSLLSSVSGIPARAAGGPVLPGMTYLVGEHGPELLTMGRGAGMITPGAGGAGAGVMVNIHNYGQPMEQQQSSHFDGEQYVIDVVTRNIANNGAIRRSIGG